MERLIEQVYEQYMMKGFDVVGIGEKNAEVLDRVAEKLYEYEQAEEEGNLVQLPCKVGRTVYQIVLLDVENGKLICRIWKGKLIKYDIYEITMGFWIKEEETKEKHFMPISSFERTVFLTKEEAEAKRKEMEESK